MKTEAKGTFTNHARIAENETLQHKLQQMMLLLLFKLLWKTSCVLKHTQIHDFFLPYNLKKMIH